MSRPPAAGFTVMELLVATAILTMIAGMLFSIFGKASDAWLYSEATVNRQQNARLTMEMMSRELSQALVTTGNANTVNFFGSGSAVYFVAPVPPVPYVSGSPYQSDLAEFGYRFVPDAGGNSTNITRYFTEPTKANLDAGAWNIRDGAPLFFTNSFGSTNILAENVLDLQFQYYSTNGGPYSTWSTVSATLDQTNQLPSVIEVTAVIMDSRSAAHIPAASYAAYTNRYARTISMAIHLFNAQ